MPALLVAAAASLILASHSAAQPVQAPSLTIPASALPIDVAARPISRPVAPGFLGLSIEYSSAPYYFGTDPSRPNPLFLALIRQLDPDQSPVLRFGGDTTDWTWWHTPGVARPRGIRYTLDESWVDSTRAMAQALNARLILGINLEADSAPIAGTEANELLTGLGSKYVAGFELGNEPEVYGTLGWYATPNGVEVPGRPPSYDFNSYLSDFGAISSALPRSVPLVGPASGAQQWLDGLGRYLRADRRVGMVTFHRYPLQRCYTPRNSPAYPTIGNLLSPIAASGPADSVQAAVAVARSHGLPFRVDELNSVSCGGDLGVSDTFASALWVVNALFNMAEVGVDGVNIHTFRNAWYEPFAFSHADGQWAAQVKPLYYGMLMFAQAAPAGSTLLETSPAAAEPLQIWATRAPGGPVRVVLINDSLRRWMQVAVRPPAPAASALAESLRAPRVGATGGVTLAGQTFGQSTRTGALAGPLQQQTVAPIKGRFLIHLAPASATLLTLGG
jgi:hypothetical protein